MGYYTNLLKDTAVLKTVDGTDENGRPNIIALDEIDCKIEFKNSVSIGSNGEEITSSGRLYTESAAKTGDIIELKDKEYIARYAREKYLYSADGEYIIKLPDGDEEDEEMSDN